VVWQQRLSGKLAFGPLWLCWHVQNLVTEGFKAFAKGLVGLLPSLTDGGLFGQASEWFYLAAVIRAVVLHFPGDMLEPPDHGQRGPRRQSIWVQNIPHPK
jgi:hypothetical protein